MVLQTVLRVLALAATAASASSSSCRGLPSDEPHCTVPAAAAASASAVAPSQHLTALSAAAPPGPCKPGSFGCPITDPAFDLSKVQFAGNFGDNMVLQRSPQRAAVYGTATPGAQVQLVFEQPGSGFLFSKTVSASSSPAAEQHGTWKVLLPARPVGTDYTLTVTCSSCPNTTAVVASKISMGDVWLCSGQSNMVTMLIHSQ
eukprot:SAG11_NODE_1295_length_5275_cov_3.069165_7_plen_202_part_00